MLKYVVSIQQQTHILQWRYILKAGLDGIKNKLTPPAPVDRNIYVMNKEEREEEGIIDLPATLACST